MRKPVWMMAATPLLFVAVPAWAQLDADDTQVVRGRGPATSARIGDNSGRNVGQSDNSTGVNANPTGGRREAGPNGNPAGRNTTRETGPNHTVDGRGNIDVSHGTVNGVGSLNGTASAPEPLTKGSSNEANAALTRSRDRVNGNPSAVGAPAKPTPGAVNNPGGSFRGANGSRNEGSNLPGSSENENRRGGNSIDTGLLNTVRSRNDNGGRQIGGDNSIFGNTYGNSADAPDPGTGSEWNGNGPDATDNGTAAQQPKPRDSGLSGPNSRGRQGDANSGPRDTGVNQNDKDGSGAKSSGSSEEKPQGRNSGSDGKGDSGGGGGSGGENDNKPAQGNGSPDRPEEDRYGSTNPIAGAIAGRRAGEIVGRGLGRDVTGAHRDEQRQDNEDAAARIGGLRNVLTGERAVNAPGNKGLSPLLRQIVKDAQERKKSQ